MRILHLIQSADPATGGPIEVIRQLGLATGHEHIHEVASLDHPAAPFAQSFPLPLHLLGPGSILGYSSRLIPWLMENARQYDFVVVHGLWRFVSFGSWIALRRLRLKYGVMTHGMLDPWTCRNQPIKHMKKWMFWPWTEYRLIRDARVVMFTSEEERRLARHSFWPYRCVEAVTPVSVSGPPPIDRLVSKVSFCRAFPEVTGKRCLLYLGRIHLKKGGLMLVEAFARQAHRDPNLHLVMAGPGSNDDERQMRALAESHGVDSRITWTGMLQGELKWGAFFTSETYVLPSHHENFGISVVEALACGTPVLISDKVQIWREIAESGAGLVEPDTMEGTQELLRRWLELTPGARESMRSAATRCYEQRFSSRRTALRTMEVYRTAATPSVSMVAG
jgi:glycosyltransferase involved in cell wall biosynthesis